MNSICQKPSFNEFKKLVPLHDKNSHVNYLIVLPKFTANIDQQYSFPTGIAYISSALKCAGYRIYTINLNYKQDSLYALLSRAISEYDIHVVATGGLTGSYQTLKAITDTVKSIDPSIITIMGGGIITGDPETAMEGLETVDYGVIGEGEITICELASAIEQNADVSQINGIIYSKDNVWTRTSPRDEISDLDIIPWPDFENFSIEEMLEKSLPDIYNDGIKGNRSINATFGRSCMYNCTFCFHSSGKKYRQRSIASIMQEIEYYVHVYNINRLDITDEMFIRHPEYVEEFCRRIKPLGIRWSANARVDALTYEITKLMKNSGCTFLSLGLESACDKILKSMRKNITVAQIENALDICNRVGMTFQGNFIFGDLEETFETAMETINWRRSHRQHLIKMHWIIVYPGTYLYQVACERNLITNRVQFMKDGCPEINVSQMTADERKEIARIINNEMQEDHDILLRASVSVGTSGKVTLDGICPYCGEAGSWNNVDLCRPVKAEVCQHCDHILHIFPYDYIDFQTFDLALSKLIEDRPAALWPAVPGVSDIIARSSVLQNENIYVVDSSSYKQGGECHTKIIHSPNIILEKEIDTVFLTITTPVIGNIVEQIHNTLPSIKHIFFLGEILHYI